VDKLLLLSFLLLSYSAWAAFRPHDFSCEKQIVREYELDGARVIDVIGKDCDFAAYAIDGEIPTVVIDVGKDLNRWGYQYLLNHEFCHLRGGGEAECYATMFFGRI